MKSVSASNSRLAVATIVGQRGRTPTREFLRLQSHFLFAHHFFRVRRPNEKGHVERLIGLADRHTLIERGRVAWQGSSAELDADHGLWHRYLGV